MKLILPPTCLHMLYPSCSSTSSQKVSTSSPTCSLRPASLATLFLTAAVSFPPSLLTTSSDTRLTRKVPGLRFTSGASS